MRIAGSYQRQFADFRAEVECVRVLDYFSRVFSGTEATPDEFGEAESPGTSHFDHSIEQRANRNCRSSVTLTRFSVPCSPTPITGRSLLDAHHLLGGVLFPATSYLSIY